MNEQQYIISVLNSILATYQSMLAYFYQNIQQKQFTNNYLATYKINYDLLLPASKFQTDLNTAQVDTQLQEYITLCGVLIDYINNNVDLQTNLFYEKIQNTLDESLAQINGFASSLLQAKYDTLFTYTVPYDMGFTTVLYLNNIDLAEYANQASLNYSVLDFNNILRGANLTLSRF